MMSRDELRAAMARLDAQALALDAEAAAASKPEPLADAGTRRAVLREVGAIARAWSKATPEARRTIVGHLATSAEMAAGRPVAFTWRSAEELAEGSG